MVQIGYKLSSEEQRPSDLVRYAAQAEDAGFTFAMISDHYHPWIDAIDILRLLWQGGYRSHRGRHFTVENARLYTLPTPPPPIMIAVGGPKSAELAARLGDGMVGTSPRKDMLKKFEAAGGRGTPRYGELTVCWAKDEKTARRTAHQIWPTVAMASSLSWELSLPKHFQEVAELVTEDAVAEQITCGPDSGKHLAAIGEFADAGYDHVCMHQVGPDQEGFIRFYEREIIPEVTKATRRKKAA